MSSTSGETYKLISDAYAHAAQQNASNSHANNLVARSFGYSAEDLAAIPSTSNLGMSCGNPLALAHVKPGETVVDLGSGGGLDLFIASPLLGPTGRAIGVDMTPCMVSLARQNAEAGGYENVEFIEARITDIPLEDGTVDVIMSNCVINLVPDDEKPKVFAEVWRLLKSGGRFAVSDVLAKGEMPEEMRGDAALLVGCIAGASRVKEYEKWIRQVGFKDLMIVDTKSDLNIYKKGILSEEAVGVADAGASSSSCCKPTPASKQGGCCGAGAGETAKVSTDSAYRERLKMLDLNEYVGAYQVYAVKP